MSKLNKQLFISACSALALSACGGGGGSEETKPISPPPAQVVPTLSLYLDQSTLTVNEKEQGTIGITITYTGQSTIDYTVSLSSDISGVTAEIANEELKVSASELENEHVITLIVKASSAADNLSAEQTVDITLSNSSVATVIDEVGLWTDVDAIFKFDDFDLVAPIYAKAAYFNNALTNAEYQTKISNISTIKAEAVSKKSSEENTLLSVAVADYQENSITETELVAMLNGVKILANNEYNKLAEQINELAELTDETLPLLSVESFGYVNELGVFSGVIGVESMGTFKEGEWYFSETYQFLEPLIPALGKNNECSAN
ncbi:hypothetical protein NBRC116592_17060 [Colwellia sp. KU-HH00111]|uniref:hypothetical protein n=1 Tax=Colwellia sp. KU-HH00111 TaxID=3127652 RepID=UPI0031076D35